MANETGEQIQVAIVANVKGLIDGLSQATSGVKAATSEMQSTFGGLAQTINNLKAPFLALTGILAGGAMFKGMISETVAWTGEVKRLSLAMETNLSTASAWAVMLHTLGISADTMGAVMQRLKMRADSQGEAFRKLGVETRDAHTGAMLPSGKILESIITRYNGLATQTDKNTLLQKMFGRSWMEVQPIMRATAERMEEAKKEMQEFGLEVGPDGVAKAREYKEAMNKISLVGMALGNMVGKELLPILTKAGKWLGEYGPAACQGMAATIKILITGFFAFKASVEVTAVAIQTYLMALWDIMKNLAQAWYKFMTMDYKGAWDQLKKGWQELKIDVVAGTETMADSIKNAIKSGKDLWADSPTKKAAGDDGGAPGLGDDGKTTSILQKWEAELQKIQAKAYEVGGDLAKMGEASEREFWAGKLSILESKGKKYSDDWIKIRTKMAQLGQAIDKEEKAAIEKAIKEREEEEKKAAAERREIEKETAREVIAEQKDIVSEKKQLLEEDLSNGKISNAKYIQQMKAMLAQELQIDKAALDAELKNDNLSVVDRQKITNQKLSIERKFNQQVNQLERQGIQQRREQWQSFFQAITGGFSSAVQGLVKGTMTWGQAFQQVLTSALDGLINFFVQWGLKEAEQWLLSQVMGEQTRTTQAIGQASVYAVNAASSVAAIPFYGWAMAPGVMAEAYSSGLAMASLASASGGWDRVPSDQVAQIHKDEMVMSAPLANGIRDMISNGNTGGGGGGTTIHLNVSTMDAKSFKDALHQNRGGLFDVLKGGYRDGRLKVSK